MRLFWSGFFFHRPKKAQSLTFDVKKMRDDFLMRYSQDIRNENFKADSIQ